MEALCPAVFIALLAGEFFFHCSNEVLEYDSVYITQFYFTYH